MRSCSRMRDCSSVGLLREEAGDEDSRLSEACDIGEVLLRLAEVAILLDEHQHGRWF